MASTYKLGEVPELEAPVLFVESVGPDVFLAFLAIALFSSRKTRSKSSGNPGQSRPDFLQLPHVGFLSSHCSTSVSIRGKVCENKTPVVYGWGTQAHHSRLSEWIDCPVAAETYLDPAALTHTTTPARLSSVNHFCYKTNGRNQRTISQPHLGDYNRPVSGSQQNGLEIWNLLVDMNHSKRWSGNSASNAYDYHEASFTTKIAQAFQLLNIE